LPRRLRERLLACAHAAGDAEICGLIGGIEGRLLHAYPVENRACDRRRFFEMDPRGQLDAMRQMRAAGQELLAIYHSHLAGPAYPSPTDLARHAYPGTLYLIISITQPVDARLRGFLIRDRQVQELSLVVG
jgi:proteasome lid subunit RPN8/RPN11